MTREDEIKQKADEVYPRDYSNLDNTWTVIDSRYGNRLGFRIGAEWADEHPISPWIAIEDRLPDKEDIYFTRCYDKAEDNEYFEVDWNQSDMRFMNPHTTHWMPIPELPK